ncbi:glycoside hydrolase family 2 protein [Streptomyces daliensis]|uniref:beta-mannosidase n=1 Tax=Streptomyces daliensis TaxID=299421 RepID=A0A8T4IMX4_9ACTN|nr:glycoside hydrolase family 2 protein [Streptomyces daliensis]
MKDVTPLCEGWTLHHETPCHEGRSVPATPATVPGCVHTDLLAAGLIPDPYLGENERDVAWVGRADWTYTTTLPARQQPSPASPEYEHERTDLVFDGLDTVAAVTLGGRLLATTRNMHRSYRFDVTEALRTGTDRTLAVRFTSAYTEAESERDRLGDRPNSYPEPFPYLRKMACSFGWDWGPTLVTAGIWKPVRLEHWSTARLACVRPLVTVEADGTTGRVEAHVEIERAASGQGRPLTAELRVAGVRATVPVAPDATGTVVTLRVPDVRLWWPRGHGEQPLYDCEVTLHGPAKEGPAEDGTGGATLDSWTRRVGFRTVALDTSPDAHGTAFALVVNGRRIFARGVNWIPDDTFPSRITPARYAHRLRQAAEANVDLVRVWGGGLYESEAFYDACDALGLLVWQDFPFACAAYPEEEPLRSEVEAEARENVTRLASHPSLALWCGNNENLWGHEDWDWKPRLGELSWGEGYYLDLLPRVVAELDPTRPYWPGSPWSGSWDHHPNDPAHGTHHSWEVWNRTDYADYLRDVPRFVAEFGWQAPPAWATLRRALPDDPLTDPASPGMLQHQKAADGNTKLARGLARHFTGRSGSVAEGSCTVAEGAGATSSSVERELGFDAWHYLAQLTQVRAVSTGIEHWRSHWPRCAGTVVWQLNDCWPVTSWAAVDGDGRAKPLHHELRRLYADRLLTFQEREGALTVVAVNQSRTEWSARLVLRRHSASADGAVLAESTLPFTAGPDAVAVVPLPPETAGLGDAAKEFLTAETEGVAEGGTGTDGLRALHFACPDSEFAWPRPRIDVALAPGDEERDGTKLVVTAHTLVRDLLLQPDRLAPGAAADHGVRTLLPGESVTLTVTGWPRPSAEAARTALYCVNAPGGLARMAPLGDVAATGGPAA